MALGMLPFSLFVYTYSDLIECQHRDPPGIDE
jgi:hypothetical protein